MKPNPMERLINGIVKENPTFVLMLGMCPTLAVTTSAINGAGMGLSTTAVLMFSNMIISALRNVIPDRVRIPRIYRSYRISGNNRAVPITGICSSS